MADDQIHEQLNAMVKGEGGAVRITENDATLRRLMVSAAVIGRMVTDYEAKTTGNQDINAHHKRTQYSAIICFRHQECS